jgi:hypothetical protein
MFHVCQTFLCNACAARFAVTAFLMMILIDSVLHRTTSSNNQCMNAESILIHWFLEVGQVRRKRDYSAHRGWIPWPIQTEMVSCMVRTRSAISQYCKYSTYSWRMAWVDNWRVPSFKALCIDWLFISSFVCHAWNLYLTFLGYFLPEKKYRHTLASPYANSDCAIGVMIIIN